MKVMEDSYNGELKKGRWLYYLLETFGITVIISVLDVNY